MAPRKIAPDESKILVTNSDTQRSIESRSKTRSNLKWECLSQVKYLTHGGFSYIYKARLNEKPVVIKRLKPKFRVMPMAINGIEDEVAIQSKLNHKNIVNMIGSGLDNRGDRFVVMERLNGGTLSQVLGYNSISRLWRKKPMAYSDVLNRARSLAIGMQYLHDNAIPNGMVLHRDLKPDNIGFMSDGTVKVLDFGLARILVNDADDSSKCNEAYSMSAQIGSLRYMAPEVAHGHPYNHKVDVYSFGMILWEMMAGEKPFRDLYNLQDFLVAVFHCDARPPLKEEWPEEFRSLISDCWAKDMDKRPDFRLVIPRIDKLLADEEGKEHKSVARKSKSSFVKRFSRIVNCRRDK